MRTYGRVAVYGHFFLPWHKFAVSDQLHAPKALLSGKSSAPNWIGGRVGPKADLVCMQKRKFLTQPGLQLRLLGRPVHSQYVIIA
jgi:hypothetical protein